VQTAVHNAAIPPKTPDAAIPGAIKDSKRVPGRASMKTLNRPLDGRGGAHYPP